MSSTDPLAIQKLATRHPAASLLAAAAAKSAATLLVMHKPDAIPDAVRETVASFAHLLQAALGSVGELDEDEC